jgi:phosphate starvation-inducible PhoH-like protein
MSKKSRVRHQGCEVPTVKSLELRQISPLTVNQELAFKSYWSGANQVLHGYAGTGKSFISAYLALDEVINERSYEQVMFLRSVVPSRDIGFLPGSIKDKIKVYEEPYYEIVNDLFGRGDAYDQLKHKGLIDFTTTSFLRGKTFRNSIIIVDEMQNMSFQELDTVMTRVGEGSKIIFCGDFRQTDFVREGDKTGILRFINITRQMHRFDYIEFEKADIVRSGLVKDYIIARTEMETA